MKIKLAASCLVAFALLLPGAGYSADTAMTSTKVFVKDSVITTKIKADLAAEKLSSLVKISVETDEKGMVSLGGTAADQSAVDKAVSIARGVKGVMAVENNIKIVAAK
jgi:hyperosmotically inducible protein